MDGILNHRMERTVFVVGIAGPPAEQEHRDVFVGWVTVGFKAATSFTRIRFATPHQALADKIRPGLVTAIRSQVLRGLARDTKCLHNRQPGDDKFLAMVAHPPCERIMGKTFAFLWSLRLWGKVNGHDTPGGIAFKL